MMVVMPHSPSFFAASSVYGTHLKSGPDRPEVCSHQRGFRGSTSSRLSARYG